MDLKLKDKVIIVTGGGRGIGRGIAVQLAAEEAIPVIVGINEEDNLKVVDEIKSSGGVAYQYVANLVDPEACKSSVVWVVRHIGKIDGLVNNAGVNDGVGLENGSYEGFVASLHKNVIHYYLMTKYCLPELKKSMGAIINIGSKVSDTGQGGTSAYTASNGARSALTREWALELAAFNIRVNAIIVGECWTPLYEEWISSQENPEEKLASVYRNIPLGNRMTTIEEVANTAVFLLSPRAGHTTGQLMHVDGGYVHLDRALSQPVGMQNI